MVNRSVWRFPGAFRRSAAIMLAAVMLLATALAGVLYLPEMTENGQKKKNGTVVDAGHANEGYVYVKHRESKKRLKLRIASGGETYTYDLNQNGEFELFPLQMGSGTYKISVYEQVRGTQYSGVSSISIKAEIDDENLPFLYPSQYVMFGADSQAVAMSDELCAGLATDVQKAQAIEAYVTDKFMYDYMKAVNIGSVSTYLPDVDSTLAEKKGICFDFAALVCCMLRAQGIPTQLVIGYADARYHAWNRVLIDGSWRLIDTTAAITGTNVRIYTPERRY